MLFPTKSKAPIVSLSKNLYPCWSVLVGVRNGFNVIYQMHV